jgi:flavodoxin
LNRRKFVGLLGIASASAAGLLIADQQHSQNSTAAPITPIPVATEPGGPGSGDGTALIVFFSHKRATYPEMNLEVGHTQRLAEIIHARVEADIFRVEPTEEYPEDYDALDRMAEEEVQNRHYRNIRPGSPDTDRYSTVFLGYPVWWSAQPMALQTFMRDHNLNGKTIVPFCTHEGSRFGNSLDVLQQYYPDAEVRDGFARRGRDVYQDLEGTSTAVNGWLQGQGF